MNNTTIAMAVSASLSLGLFASSVNATEVRDIVNLNTVDQGVHDLRHCVDESRSAGAYSVDWQYGGPAGVW